MVIRDADRDVAQRLYAIAVGMVAMRELEPIAGFARDALDNPTPATVGALLVVGQNQPWLSSVLYALAHVGIAAVEDVLGDRI